MFNLILTSFIGIYLAFQIVLALRKITNENCYDYRRRTKVGVIPCSKSYILTPEKY